MQFVWDLFLVMWREGVGQLISSHRTETFWLLVLINCSFPRSIFGLTPYLRLLLEDYGYALLV